MKALLISIIALLTLAPAALGQAKKNPHGDISWECFDCHNTESWNVIKPEIAFKHEKTGFPLIGQHAKVACLSCHKNLAFSHIASACVDCHTDIHRGQFGNDCQSCHSPQNWESKHDVFELHSSKGFPLVGLHSIADCNACHINQQKNEFAMTPVQCRGCHESNFKTATDPNHTLAGFSADCQSCHQPVAANWNNSTYQHPAAFALHGAHAKIDCASCHATQFAGLSNQCVSCHENDFNATTNPAHLTFGFPTTCETCHDDVSWNRAQFDHLQASNFELRGAHINIQCIACHIDNQIHDLPTNCYGCHQNAYMQATNPNHSQGNFPQDCLQCHNESAWQPATFDHANTQFPLTGAHSTIQCIACHSAGYQNTPTDC
ncbi:MAG TPA: hypothetical protein DCZ43_01795, partial [candidate division Zixibacteria bacterium]|nr:hypothetical protein [candidate division Zixibacteria bacterium]